MSIIDQIKNTFPNFALVTFINQIESNLSGCETILDVGCGDLSPLRLLSQKYTMTGIDGYKKSLTISKERGIHARYIHLDITKLSTRFKSKSYDAVIALDVIEHLKKQDGYKFLRDMEKIAKKVVILNTPNGFIDQHNKSNLLQEHLSGWSVKDFLTKGYTVLGMYGLKSLRKDEGKLRFNPIIFWGIISFFSHYLFTKNNPNFSFSLMAIKKISSNSVQKIYSGVFCAIKET